MLNVTEKQKTILSNVIPNLKELIETDNLGDLLLSIDDVIVDNIIDNGDEPDDEGIKLQLIYDQIYNQNQW